MIEDVKIYVTDFAEQFEPIRYEFDGKSTIYYDALTVNDDSDVLRMGFVSLWQFRANEHTDNSKRERDAPGHEYMCLVTMKDQGGRRWEIASVACLYITEKNVEEGLAGATEPEDVEKHAKKKQKRTPGDSEANGIHVS